MTPPPSPGPATARYCARLDERLPDDLGEGMPRRRTAPPAPGTTAYGDPPVVVRCGVPPVTRPPGDTRSVEVNGVEWYPVESPDAVTWTTVDQPVPVEARIPTRYEGQLVARLTPAVSGAAG